MSVNDRCTVNRIGLHQLEVFRQDLMNAIKKCSHPKVQHVVAE